MDTACHGDWVSTAVKTAQCGGSAECSLLYKTHGFVGSEHLAQAGVSGESLLQIRFLQFRQSVRMQWIRLFGFIPDRWSHGTSNQLDIIVIIFYQVVDGLEHLIDYMFQAIIEPVLKTAAPAECRVMLCDMQQCHRHWELWACTKALSRTGKVLESPCWKLWISNLQEPAEQVLKCPLPEWNGWPVMERASGFV